MAYADQQMSTNKIVAIILVAIIHIAIGYALITGLAYNAVKKAIERVTTVDVSEPPPPPDEPPPPPPDDIAPPPPVAPPPPISIAVAPPPIQTVDTPPPPRPVFTQASQPPPPPPPPPAPSQARKAQSQGNWSQRIIENYPARAIREETEGTVGVSVVIGPDGRVSSCSVSSSSGSSVLDAAACDGMRRYARFKPALNAAGEPTTDNYSTRIVYRLD